MLTVTKRRYKKQHVVGGAGIFDTVVNLAKRFFSSKLVSKAALGAAEQAGKHLVNKVLAPAAVQTVTQPAVTQKSRDDLARLINEETNINNLMMGRGTALARPVAIQDLVKRINGTGIKVV